MRKFRWFIGVTILALISIAARIGLDSSVFDWEKHAVKKTPSGDIRSFLNSPTRSLDMFDIKAVTLSPLEQKWKFKVENGTDELIIIKEGDIDIQVDTQTKILGEGSVIVAGSGSEVTISCNKNDLGATFYLVHFKPFHSINTTGNTSKVSPVFIDWKDAEFKPSENGGRRNIMQQQTSALKELEIHVTTLKEGLPSHAAHTHPDEEIILVRKGFVEQTIKGNPYRLGPGSIIFITNDDLHGISNAGNGICEYYAIRWLTNQTGSE